ncbi:hypothetical protein BCV72DRAFT_23648 [Rhizopus microsporus var. microsporus]|uniref:Ankyrin n=1 Tax=Rhizopus microsporus var. microsporus TaxID=86635 RepID=A0A1X0QVX9_RHIZD|nr:hypothetical protein BCV72DRAFT_23648 [Rhizopus microsporus var. microsporus]
MSSTTAGTQHTLKKPCNSVSCCSPSRLWKSIQQVINQDKREEFKTLCQDKTKIPHLVRVILSSRLSNNPLLYSKSTTVIDSRLNEKFGKLSATDLNAVEISLLQHKHDTFAYWTLQLLKKHAKASECKQFVNHQFGKQGNTALHLAAFWGMSRLVRLMLELGADPSVQNNRQLRPIDCTTHADVIALLEPKAPAPKHSLLLKKAVQTITNDAQYYADDTAKVAPPSPDYFMKPSPSPLSFSSSSSSSSSSFSSLDQHWTPPASPVSHLDKIPPLPPSPAPVLTPIKKKKNEINETLMVQEHEDEEDEVAIEVPLERPGCLPRHDLPKETVLQKQKKLRQVQFDPQVIVMDSCVRGDHEELTEWIDQLDVQTIKDIQNRSLLHIALMHGNEHLVDFLVDKVDINQADQDGWTCLHYAAALGLWKSLERLLSHPQSNIHARTYHGLKIEDCPNSDFGRRKCKIIMDKVQRRFAKQH